MNILRQQDILKGVPDNGLMQEMRNPTGSVPQFLVMTELQRRKTMRDEFTARQDEPTTVVQDMTAPPMPPAAMMPPPVGMAQSPANMPGGLPQPAPPVMMESGGVVKYQRGTSTLGVRSDEEIIDLYQRIVDGKIDGSTAVAGEVIEEVNRRELVGYQDPRDMKGVNPYTGDLTPFAEMMSRRAAGVKREAPPPAGPQNVQSDTIVERLLGGQGPKDPAVEAVTEVNQEKVSETDPSFLSRVMAPAQASRGPVALRLPLPSQGGLPEIEPKRGNVYDPIKQLYTNYEKQLNKVDPIVEAVTEVVPAKIPPAVQSDTIIQRLLERQQRGGLPTSPKLPPNLNQPPPEVAEVITERSNVYAPLKQLYKNYEKQINSRPKPEPQVLSNNMGDYYPGVGGKFDLNKLKGHLSDLGKFGSRNAPVAEGSPEDLLQQYQEGEAIRKAWADMDVGMGPVTEQVQTMEDFNFGPATNNMAGMVPTEARPSPPSSVQATRPAINPAVDATLARGPIGPEGTNLVPDINLANTGVNVTGPAQTADETKVEKEIKKDPALAYEKMRKAGMKDAQAMALIMAGLGVMEAASKPGATALGSLAGAKTGVAQYGKDLQALHERIDKRRLADEDKSYKERRLGQEDRKIDINLETATAAKINAEINRIKVNQPPEAIRTINAILAETDLAKKKQMVEMYNRRFGRAPGDPYRDIKTINTINKAFAAELKTDRTQINKLRAMAKQIAKAAGRKAPDATDKAQAREQMRRLYFLKNDAADLFSSQAGGGAPTTVGPRTASLASFNKKD